jgi:hypothetical protein
LLLLHCGRVGRVESGKYEVADQEYSSQNYVMERLFDPKGAFQEKHILDRCLMMEMRGSWMQEGGRLTLSYAEMRNRASCRDSLGAFAKDSAELEIPVRNVEDRGFESYLAASEGKPDKWIRWLKVE